MDQPKERVNADEIGYMRRLQRTTGAPCWMAWGPQLPYRLHIRRIVQGQVLDVGCGTGRNLIHLGRGVGIDTNPHSVTTAVANGVTAFTPPDFTGSDWASQGRFDTLLFAHVLEHMPLNDATELVNAYLGYLKTGGRVVVIVPQEAGFASDDTHVAPVGMEELQFIARRTGLVLGRTYSFPLVRPMGRWFKHNETISLMLKPAT